MMIRDLQYVIKPAPPLALDDTVARAIRVLRARGLPALPVTDGDRLVGFVYEADLLHLVAAAPDPRARVHSLRVGEAMRPIQLTVTQHQPLDNLAKALDESGAPAVAVTTPEGRYLGGLLLRRDVLAAIAGQPPAPPIAGLATPFGVYLTTGTLRAGANDLALAATGAALMVINLLASAVISGLAKLAQYLISPAATPPGPEPAPHLLLTVTLTFYALQVAVFLLLLRSSPLTRVHGAEHMVVHAIEEGEDLTPEKVRTMPRVHSRCGTNLMALLILLVIAQQFLSSLSTRVNEASRALALFVLVMIVLITWRRLGAGLQRWVTTRQPSERQLARAIAVGAALLNKIRNSPRPRVTLPRRIWNAGFVQVLAGFLTVAALAEYAPPLVKAAWAWLIG